MRPFVPSLFSLSVVVLLSASVGATSALGFANGPLIVVTDTTPSCAYCHSSVGTEQLRGLPPAYAAKQTVEAKHFKAILSRAGEYKALSEAERQKLVEDIKLVDANASVTLSAPSTAARGQNITATVTVRGGSGPVVGVFLLDGDIRYQARPIASDGWMVVGTPKVIGPDGAEQTKWVDGRAEGGRKNLSFIIVFGVKSDLATKTFPEAKVTWTLRAPLEPGKYTMAAAFNYGTEKASPLGAVPQAGGGFMPRGGGGGASGRIQFSTPVTITVQ